MASTFTTITALGAAGIAVFARESHSGSGTCSGDSDIVNDTQDVGTSSEIITLGEIAAGGAKMVEIVNLDEANFISVGFENPAVAGTKTFKIEAGLSGLFPMPSAALYGIADSGTVKILKKAVEA